jgi:hypothetical protein
MGRERRVRRACPDRHVQTENGRPRCEMGVRFAASRCGRQDDTGVVLCDETSKHGESEVRELKLTVQSTQLLAALTSYALLLPPWTKEPVVQPKVGHLDIDRVEAHRMDFDRELARAGRRIGQERAVQGRRGWV